MTLLEAIILGIVQGLAEFLPISSSGHLALGQLLFGIEDNNMAFIIVVHIGTLIPVVIVYRQAIWELIKKPFQKMTYLLILATVPAAIVAIFFEDAIEAALGSLGFLAVGFIVTGAVLIATDRLRKTTKRSDEITYLDALLIGVAQAVAVFPGISRSGSTITAALSRGINREDAAKFVFLMSIPAILGALLMQILHVVRGNILLEDLNFVTLGAGFLASALSGYLAINFMLAAIKKAKLSYFAYYVLTLAAAIIVGLLIF
ncbi:MAG: undecaprenyl-diphosphate phosphatase [Defluviitaleaceae bacterium]|nr:undecaprenyl-diphosphate phosphatase [Defluviitaleaceae bacterium]